MDISARHCIKMSGWGVIPCTFFLKRNSQNLNRVRSRRTQNAEYFGHFSTAKRNRRKTRAKTEVAISGKYRPKIVGMSFLVFHIFFGVHGSRGFAHDHEATSGGALSNSLPALGHSPDWLCTSQQNSLQAISFFESVVNHSVANHSAANHENKCTKA